MSVAEPLVHPDDGLPRPPSWQVRAADFLALDRAGRLQALSDLPGDDRPGYWILHQGAMAPGSQRQLLVNLDSALALQAALEQRFSQPGAPATLVIQWLPPQQAAGVLFSRHPRRPDLDQMVVELGEGQGTERLIFHPDGSLAWQSQADTDPVLVRALAALGRQLNAVADTPRAVEWVWDGAQLWLIQMLSIGSLPSPREAWTRHSTATAVQVVTPLWYTLWGRWLKAGFWRPLGRRAGWRELANIEPFRRQHSHLYLNSQFPAALIRWRGVRRRDQDLPPAWRPAGLPTAATLPRWRYIWWQWQIRRLRRRLDRALSHPLEDRWLQLMALDQMGQQLESLLASIEILRLPEQPGSRALLPGEIAVLKALAEPAPDLPALAHASAGQDPVWPRWHERPADLQPLLAGFAALTPPQRQQLARLEAPTDPCSRTLDALHALRRTLGAALRGLLVAMAGDLHQQQQLHHPDDIFFLYFDELWQCWRGQARSGLRDKLADRKVRYLTDAHSGPPDWIIDQVGYGSSAFARENRQPLLRGAGLVPGQVSAPVRRLVSGWQLNQLQPGDIIVLNRCEPGWLPWLALAGGLVMTHQDDRDPAPALARSLAIPAIVGVQDALHSVVDGDPMTLDGHAGTLSPVALS